MNYNDILFNSCLDSNNSQVKRILERYNKTTDQIDILYSDGQLFRIAISNNNFEICEALLSFFENKQNPSAEQKEKLKDILEEITSFSEISKEMQLALKNYLSYNEDCKSEETILSMIPEQIEEDNELEHDTNEDKLLNFCRQSNTQGALNVLTQCRTIDLLKSDGKIFKWAIENNNTNILVHLLQYYEETKLNLRNINPLDEELNKQKLQDVLCNLSYFISSKNVAVLIKDYVKTPIIYNILQELSDGREENTEFETDILKSLSDIKKKIKVIDDLIAKDSSNSAIFTFLQELYDDHEDPAFIKMLSSNNDTYELYKEVFLTNYQSNSILTVGALSQVSDITNSLNEKIKLLDINNDACNICGEVQSDTDNGLQE
jgi:hypothetical protein